MSNWIKVRCGSCFKELEILADVVRCRECDAPNLVYLHDVESRYDGIGIHVYDPWYSSAHNVTFNSKAEEKTWCAENGMVPVDVKHMDDLQKYKKDQSWDVDEAKLSEGIKEIEARKVAGTWNSETKDAFVAKHSSTDGEAGAE